MIHKGWLVFPHFDFIPVLSTCVHQDDSCTDLPTKVSKLSAYSVVDFWCLKGSKIVIGASFLSKTFCCVSNHLTLKLADGRLHAIYIPST